MRIFSILVVYASLASLSTLAVPQPYYSLKRTYFLQDTLSSLPCSVLTTSPPLISAAEIFQKLSLPIQTTLQSLMITAWVLLQGYEQRYYTILSVHDMGLARVFSLSYRNDINKIATQFKTYSDTDGIAFLNLQQWVFIKLQITLASTVSSIDKVYLCIKNPSYASFEKNINYYNQPGEIMTFSSQSLFNIGYSAVGLPSYPPGCAYINHVTLFLDPQPILDSLISPMHRKQSIDTQLLWHYDFHYSIANPGKIFSVGEDQDILDAPKMLNNEITSSSYFSTQTIDVEINSGFIVYFEFQLTNWTGTPNSLLIMKTIMGFEQRIEETNGTLSFNGYSLCRVLQNKWYAIVIIVDNLVTRQGFSMVKDYSNWVVAPLSYQMSSVRFSFGGMLNKCTLKLDNIRIYTGTFVASDAECLLSTGIKNYNCLFCQPGFDLSYQSGMTCVAQTSPIKVPTEKDGIQDWVRSPCPPEQIRMSPTYQCQCRLGFYFSGSLCVECPSFCKTCSDSTTCIEKDPLRDNSTGSCPFNSFDDGYSCIMSSYKIPNKHNQMRNYVGFTSSNFQAFIIQPNDLKLFGNSSFFLSFSIVQLDQIAVSQEQTLAYLRDQNQDIFSITIKKTYNTLPPMITYSCCFYSKTTLLKCLSVSQTFIWIGFWADLQSVVMALQNSGGTYYEVASVTTSPYIYPSLCIGYCKSLDTTKSIFQGSFPSSTIPSLSPIPIWLILGMTNPSDRISDLFSFAQRPSQLPLYFQFQKTIVMSSGYFYISNSSNDPTNQYINIIVTPTQINPLKGIQNHLGIAFGVQTTLLYIQSTAISMNIFINSMEGEYQTILSINQGTQIITYQIIPRISLNLGYFRICMPGVCKQTSYAILHIHQPNFVAIIQKVINPGASMFFVYEFEVVCNYKREKLLFVNQGYLNPTSFSYYMADTSNPRDIYLNNLKFFSGGNFYFDYTPEDSCFLYYDIADMKCVQPKQGFAMMNSLVIPQNECINQKNPKGTMIIFNKYTNSCYQTRYTNPKCAEINEDLVSCFKCRDPNANPALNCSCPEGTYLDKNLNTCQHCHTNCSKCSADASTCTECKYAFQSLPDCKCILSNQYQDPISFECKNCENQCDTCQGSADDCIECSSGRINPPICKCDTRYFDKTLSNKEICIAYNCNQECETCQYSPFTCVTCSAGRINPPQCTCDAGYYEQINGTNKLCLQCSSHQFYDSSTKSCLPCDLTCQECETSSNTCTQCQDDLVLHNQKCLCSDLSSFIISSTGEIQCDSGMGVSLNIESRNSRITLVFTFEENLAPIDFEAHPIDTIIYMYISSVAAENYSLNEPMIEGNKLIVKMSFTQTFPASQGNAIFLQNDSISSSSRKHFLDRKYLQTPLMFQIGPLLIADDQWEPSQQAQDTANALRSSDSDIAMQLIRQSSIIFYLLNTLQPCVAFTLTKIVIPPNLYQNLQVIALLTFPKVEDYGVAPKSYQTQLFWLELKDSNEISMNSMDAFRRVSYSNCMLVNIPIAIAQSLVVPIIYVVFMIIEKIALSPKINSFCEKTSRFLQSKIHSSIETSLFLMSTAILNQFYNVDQAQYFNRMSVYISIVVVSFSLIFYFQIYMHLGILALPENHSKLKETLFSSKEKVYLKLVDKLNFQCRPRTCRDYFFMQIIKKYLLSVFLVGFQNYPRVSFAGCAGVFGVSLIISLRIRPYKTKIDNACKIIGESCLLTSWMIYLLQFVPFQVYFQKDQQIPEEKVETFIFYGKIVLGLLVTFNLMYCFQFIWSKIIFKLINKLKAKSKPITPSAEESEKEKTNHSFLKYNQKYLQSLDVSFLVKNQQAKQIIEQNHDKHINNKIVPQ